VEYANIIVDVTNSHCTTMLGCYTRDNLSFIHLCFSRPQELQRPSTAFPHLFLVWNGECPPQAPICH